MLKSKSRLLEITAQLTAGVVNGRRMQVRPVIKPPWAEKTTVRDEGPPQLPLNVDGGTGPEGEAETPSDPSKEQLRAQRNQHGWPHFRDVFMLSSVDREDVETLKVHVTLRPQQDKLLDYDTLLTD